MHVLRALPFLALCAFLQGAGPERGQGELHYRVHLQFRGDAAPVDSRFILQPTPTIETHNRVKKPRMGGWRLEAEQRKGEAFGQAAVLARMERMLYFSGPSPTTFQKPIVIRYGERRCQVWQVETPPGLHVYAYLVEVSPGILALSYLSGSFDTGDVASVELQLESFHLDAGVSPAEDGTALIATLQRLARAPREEPGLGGGPSDSEFIQVD